KAGPGRIDADGGVEAGIFLGMPQTVDAVAHDEAHGAGIVVRPNGLGAVRLSGADKLLGDEVERVVPRNRSKLAAALGAHTPQRLRQPVGMMNTLGVTRDLGADHAGRIGIVLRAANAADRMPVEDLDLERAGRGAVVWTRRSDDAGADGLVHRLSYLGGG